jgi:hypothetical protein
MLRGWAFEGGGDSQGSHTVWTQGCPSAPSHTESQVDHGKACASSLHSSSVCCMVGAPCLQTGDRYTAIPWSLLPDGLHVNPGWTLRHLPDGEASCAPAALRPHHPPSLRLTPKSPSLVSLLNYPHLLDDMGMRLSCAEDTAQMCRTRGRGAHSQQTFPPGRANLAATSCVPSPSPSPLRQAPRSTFMRGRAAFRCAMTHRLQAPFNVGSGTLGGRYDT